MEKDNKHKNEIEAKYGKNNDSADLIAKIPTKVIDEQLSEILDTVKIIDSTCTYPKCKTKVTLIGEDCKQCRKRFCFKHSLPEVHGCGEAVKNAERKEFLHPKPLKTIRHEEDLAKAKKRMDELLKSKQLQRTQKPSGSSTGKKKKK